MLKKCAYIAIAFLSNVFNMNRLCVCRFTPSCSLYARDAVQKHGIVKGATIAAHRLLRCHPLSEARFDPVAD